MGIHARRGPASLVSKNEAAGGQNGDEGYTSKTKKSSKVHHYRLLALLRNHGATIQSTMFAYALLLLLVLLGFQKGLFFFAEDVLNGGNAQGLHPKRRLHTISYLDYHSNKRVTRTIRLATPRRQSSFKSLNYAESESEPWFDFNLPDQGVAFPIPRVHRKPCYPMATWQTSVRQTCNHFHELEKATRDTMSMRFINCGENRCTFLLDDDSETYVLKTVFMSYINSSDRYGMAAKDSMALEKLSSSPYVINLYASCALAQLVEYSSGGNIHDLLKRSRQRKQLDALTHNDTNVKNSNNMIEKEVKSEISGNKHRRARQNQQLVPSQIPGAHDKRFVFTSQMSKLKIAYHVATAVADVHALEDHPYGLPSMAYNDLCCHQFLLVGGVYKLGDFDWATILTQTKPEATSSSTLRLRTNDPPDACQTTPLKMSADYLKALAPEELVYYEDLEDALADQGYEGESYEATRVYRDKLDVYQVGSIIYLLLTYLWIWEGHTTYEAMVNVVHVSIADT